MPGHFTFFTQEVKDNQAVFGESEAKHMIQVLRFSLGDSIVFTDGKGKRFRAEITDSSKKAVQVKILNIEEIPSPEFTLVVGVLKSTDRMEWLLEKAVELGVKRVVWIACENSERSKIFLEKLIILYSGSTYSLNRKKQQYPPGYVLITILLFWVVMGNVPIVH